MTTPTDVLDLSAEALSAAIHRRQVSCRELMQATLDRIASVNPRFNAIVSLADPQALLAEADARDAELAPRRSARGSRGWMHGMPQAIKDSGHATGFPTTFGSPLLAQAFPAHDSVYVERMKAAGCIVIGKTNMPELGLGSHTYNPLFGCTPNAWDPQVSGGGSSGGAAVALALRLLPVADGSDVMGSLRNPAGWNHVFGLRPSQGRIPEWPRGDAWTCGLGTDGPMARTVRDLAALLSTQAGHDPRSPMSLSDAPCRYVPTPRQSTVRGLRVAWLGDLGGHLPLEPGIAEVCQAALQRMAGAGAHVEPARLDVDLDAVWRAWLVWRQAMNSLSIAPLAATPEALASMKPEARWEIEEGRQLDLKTFTQASQVRTRFYHAVRTMFEHHDLLALPVAQVWPFPMAQTWPREVAGRPMDTYHRWMEVTLYATFAGLPAISVPAGFHANGRWPMGLQLIGRPRGEAALLAAAAGYERLVPDLLARRPEAA